MRAVSIPYIVRSKMPIAHSCLRTHDDAVKALRISRISRLHEIDIRISTSDRRSHGDPASRIEAISRLNFASKRPL